MLRVLVVALLLANGLFYAWAQGWLSPWVPARAEQREPGRLQQQVQPERVTVLSARDAGAMLAAAAASAAASGGVAAAASAGAAMPADDTLRCLEAGPFTDAALPAVLSLLQQHGVPDGSVQHDVTGSASTWAVVMGRFADREAQRAKLEELRRLGVRADELSSPAALVPGLRLGHFSDRYGAETALASLNRRGVRTARVVELPAGTLRHWLRAPQADGELQTRLRGLPGERLGAGFQACVAR